LIHARASFSACGIAGFEAGTAAGVVCGVVRLGLDAFVLTAVLEGVLVLPPVAAPMTLMSKIVPTADPRIATGFDLTPTDRPSQ